jgi:hypothetical protein
MNNIIIILIIIELIQLASLLACIVIDNEITSKGFSNDYLQENKRIKTKIDFLKFFIPLFWIVPMIKSIIKYWKNLT